MKKLFALGLTATMVLSLAACGGDTGTTSGNADKAQEENKQPATEEIADNAVAPTGDSTSITLWTYPVGGWGDSATVDSIITNFNEAHPEISVTVEYLDYTNGDDQVNTAIEGGQAPDLVLEGPERLVANWGAKGLMVDLSELFDTKAGEEMYGTVKAACQSSDGAYYVWLHIAWQSIGTYLRQPAQCSTLMKKTTLGALRISSMQFRQFMTLDFRM